MYIPPDSSCANGYAPDLNCYLPTDNALVLGDFNAHDPLWGSERTDTRGKIISDFLDSTNYGVLNNGNPTQLPKNGSPTSPNISLASLSILPYTEWETHIALNSDHLPIIITLATETEFKNSEN